MPLRIAAINPTRSAQVAVVVEVPFLPVPQVGIAARSGVHVEPLVVLGEIAAPEGRPVAVAEAPPQGGR